MEHLRQAVQNDIQNVKDMEAKIQKERQYTDSLAEEIEKRVKSSG